ncbi:MAG: DUF4197 domain-containing protein [Alphaproteobacteria bacterium]|jgi:hypothetical protein|nr:DUF4197 domain-containing protein [Alphaproteobacteria bacterium]MDP6515171.1 DUF4197 domain-containing protein [Alphaproteobacteria bacterium]
MTVAGLVAIMTLGATFGGAAGQGLLDRALDTLKSLEDSVPGASGLSEGEIADGLLEALKIGTERVVAGLSRADGFNADPEIHIPLPASLRDVQSALSLIGMDGLGNDLELKLNRAAEAAVPEARAVFLDSVSRMTIDDVRGIYEGPNDAATRYFQRAMTPALAERMSPIVRRTLAEVGAIRAFEDMMGPYQSIPLMPDVQADITGYAVEQAMAGLFHKLAQEEAAIRQDPLKRSTELLQKVFGSG